MTENETPRFVMYSMPKKFAVYGNLLYEKLLNQRPIKYVSFNLADEIFYISFLYANFQFQARGKLSETHREKRGKLFSSILFELLQSHFLFNLKSSSPLPCLLLGAHSGS